jgi:hypothetical protein
MSPAPPLLFASYRDLAEAIAQRLAGGRGHDLLAPWTEEVIVASTGVAEAIAGELLRLMPAGAAALRLDPLEALARRILNDTGEYPRIASDAERRLAMRAAARSIDDAIMESRGIGSMLERSYRDLRDSGLTLDRFPARRERSKLLLRAWREYERSIAQLGAIDAAELFDRAARRIEHGTELRPQLLAGFYDMTGAQLRFVDALNSAGLIAGIWIPTDHAFAQRFVSHFINSPSATSSIAPTETGVEIAERDTRQNELRSVCENVRTLLDAGTPPRAIGIVARSLDAHDIQLLGRHAGHLGFATSQTVGTPLVAHRFGRGVVTLLRLRERGFHRSEVLELVRDGLITRNRLDLDAIDVQTRRFHISAGTSAELRILRNRPRQVDEYIALVEELESATDVEGRPWSEVLLRFAGLFRIETEGDAAAFEALVGLSDVLHRCERIRMRLDAGAVIDAIEQCELGGAESSGPVIWTGDVMKLRGRTFEHLFVVRMQDDLFPQRRVEDPLISDTERRGPGIREIGNGREEEQLLFQLMLGAGQRSVRFSFSGTDGFGKPLRPSQLLKNFAIERDPEHRREILHDFSRYIAGRWTAVDVPPQIDRPAPARRALQLLARAGSNGIFDGYVGPRPRFDSALQSISPTQLEDFGECPQKFLLKHLLGVRDLEDPEREVQINPRDKGSLDHRILERFYRQLRVEELHEARETLPRLPAVLTRRLEAAIDTEFDAMQDESPAYNATVRDIERRAAKRNLRDFVALDFTDLLEKGLLPKHFEYRFGPKYEHADHAESFVLATAGLPLRVDGSIDRIDTDGREYRIVDYKSGKALRHQQLGKKIDRGVRLQLALYAMAVAEFFGAAAPSVSGTIKPLISGSPGRFDFNLGEKQASLTETLDTFVAAISRGTFPAFPNEGDRPDDFNSCKYCPVNHSCRTRHDLDERVLIREARDPRTLLLQLSGNPAAIERPAAQLVEDGPQP